MMSPVNDLGIDMGKAHSVLSEIGEIKEEDDMMIVLNWNGMEVTFYPSGKIMFHPLDDRETGIRYATDILNRMI